MFVCACKEREREGERGREGGRESEQGLRVCLSALSTGSIKY